MARVYTMSQNSALPIHGGTFVKSRGNYQ